MNDRQTSKIENIAVKIINVSKNTLQLKLRFMDSAIYRLQPKSANISLATDGKCFFYGTIHIIRRYRENPAQFIRDYLHVVLHCVFHHAFVRQPIDTDCWDLAVDIATENLINSLALSCVDTIRVKEQKDLLDELSDLLPSMNAEHIYRHYKDKNLTYEEMSDIRRHFLSDDHSIWYNKSKQQLYAGDSRMCGQGEKSIESMWENVSRQVQIGLELFSQRQGTAGGTMIQQLREMHREKYDYSAFLKKFAVRGEAMKINDDEFDYIFYTYGLELFGNVPLIEPLEYKEVKRIRDFVVAIDTSGSTSGDVVQRFLEKTYDILKSTESFFSKINLHIIQCDAVIQEHVRITTQEDLDTYIKGMTIKGLGGTDFRPVFSEIDRMIASEELRRLKGMIYFTDGYGTFPEQKPEYETAFVFVRNDCESPDVPPWAIKLVLNDREV